MKPILFNTDMVRAILDGRKTVTRRIVKPQPPATSVVSMIGPYAAWKFWEDDPHGHLIKPPYRQGDILYVRETWRVLEAGYPPRRCKIEYRAGGTKEFNEIIALPTASGEWRPSIHMPREAARIFLRVTNVRVERLQDITEEQARFEGAMPFCISVDSEDTPDSERTWHEVGPALPGFIRIWDSTIKPADLNEYGWDANPWVWVIEFERCNKPEELSDE